MRSERFNGMQAVMSVLAMVFATFAGTTQAQAPAQAQPQPVARPAGFAPRPIKILASTNPGSGADSVARYFCGRLTEVLGQQCIVENHPGANQVIGTVAGKMAPPDGYTMILGSNSPMAVNPVLIKDMPYDPLVDFKPVYGLAKHSNVLIVPWDSPIKTVADLVAAGKKRPLNAAVGAPLYELATYWLATVTGANFVQVPYKGVGPLSVDMLGGRLDMSIVDLAGAVPLLQPGKLRPLAVLGDHRHPDWPDVPTVKESGYPEFVNYSWTALYVRSDVPDAVTAFLADGVRRVMQEPDTLKFMKTLSLELLPLSPVPMRQFQVEEIDRFKRIAAAANYVAR